MKLKIKVGNNSTFITYQNPSISMSNSKSISSDIQAWAKTLTPTQSKAPANSSEQKKSESVSAGIQAWAASK